jgi:hypothetical protein
MPSVLDLFFLALRLLAITLFGGLGAAIMLNRDVMRQKSWKHVNSCLSYRHVLSWCGAGASVCWWQWEL